MFYHYFYVCMFCSHVFVHILLVYVIFIHVISFICVHLYTQYALACVLLTMSYNKSRSVDSCVLYNIFVMFLGILLEQIMILLIHWLIT